MKKNKLLTLDELIWQAGLRPRTICRAVGCTSEALRQWRAGHAPTWIYMQPLARMLKKRVDEIDWGRGGRTSP